MHSTGLPKCRVILLVLLLIFFAAYARPQNGADTANNAPEVRPGRYVPQLHGADRGKYMPDDSGKYRHIPVPYDGGYGDRGLKYVPDARGVFQQLPSSFALGPRDHLRFMIDFNYDGTGWQIIQFEWIRDGEHMQHYNYMQQNRLWQDGADADAAAYVGMAEADALDESTPDAGDDVATGMECASNCEQSSDASAVSDGTADVHVDAEYKDSIYNVTYSNQNAQDSGGYDNNVQSAISEVLEYVQRYILPTLP